MPPKTKLHKTTGKAKSLPSTSTQNVTPLNTSVIGMSTELEQQFETELCWCIQQLQNALRLGKLNPKQVQDHTKALNTLMSNSAPIVKKRQVMRLSFGDYRTKMTAEDKKLSSANAKVKMTAATPSNKSVFVKKSNFVRSDNSFKFEFPNPEDSIADKDSSITHAQSDNSFKFEFPNPEDSIADKVSNITLQSENCLPDKFHFTPSTNQFKFNFDVKDVV